MRTTKIFINDIDTTHKDKHGGEYIRFADTISGYVLTQYTDEADPLFTKAERYFINTTQPLTDNIINYKRSYLARFKDHKEVAKRNGATVAAGNINKRINKGKGTKTAACFIAVFDDDKCSFEIHYPTGAIFYTTHVEFIKNEENQRESDYKEMTDQEYDLQALFPAKVIPTARRREGATLSYQDEQAILKYLQNNKTLPKAQRVTQKALAKSFKVSSPYISKLKKQWKAEGKL